MVVSLVIALCAALVGWFRAARRGGTTADRLQYAAAHGIPAFLLSMIALTIIGHMGWLGLA